ncbi:hypothetical protein PVAP13_8NG163001 [Panicum virgatum]|uniref:Uncharacterized protein n=1 Tax=Panicum virgatum TaxID=38727 RepID=A0A8T0P8C0_PANVG|nr:hypothetical protein PVAP13_8NG163001 [Panicum virgatum]
MLNDPAKSHCQAPKNLTPLRLRTPVRQTTNHPRGELNHPSGWVHKTNPIPRVGKYTFQDHRRINLYRRRSQRRNKRTQRYLEQTPTLQIQGTPNSGSWYLHRRCCCRQTSSGVAKSSTGLPLEEHQHSIPPQEETRGFQPSSSILQRKEEQGGKLLAHSTSTPGAKRTLT